MKRNKITAMILAMIMVLTMIPSVAFAGVNNAEDDPSSYGYEETAADSVKVYVTVSNDGMPLKANDEDETVTAHMEVNVPYFDLKEYGLENYYRYETKNGTGSYINKTLVERPTTLHLFIYIAERYYLGLDENDCGVAKEVSKVLDYAKETEMFYMDGTSAYTGKLKAFTPGGAPTSFYIAGGFWGHDENLNYYRNHRYPLMSPAWGATADYMLLSDGDIIEVAMNTDWDKISSGYNLCFNKDDFEGEAGDEITVTSMSARRSAWGDKETPVLTHTEELSVILYDAEWNKTDAEVKYNGDGTYNIKLPEKTGEYYLLGTGLTAKTKSCVDAPATAKVVVTEKQAEPTPEPTPTPEPEQPQEPSEDELKAEAVKAAEITATAKATSYAKVKVSWNKVAEADKYQVYRATSKNGNYTRISTTASTSINNTKNVKTGKTYYYKVRAMAEIADETLYSDFSAVKSAKPVLAKVTGVKAKAAKKKITVSWKKVAGANGYKIYRYNSSTGKYKVVKTVTKGSTVKWTNSSLKKGKTYRYKIKAYRNVDGKKVYSPSYSAVVKAKVK